MNARGRASNTLGGQKHKKIDGLHAPAMQVARGVSVETLESRTLLSGTLSPAATPLPSALPVAEQVAGFTPGASVADPTRDVVYMVDVTDQKVLAINTDSGTTTASAKVPSPPGGVAVSVAADRLFVAEPGVDKIQVYSLPGLTPLKSLDTGVPIYRLVAGAGDKLYGVTSSSGDNQFEQIVQLDAQTGTVLQTLKDTTGTLDASIYFPMLKTNPAGTHLYIKEIGLSGGGGVPEYDISGANPSYVKTYASTNANGEDFTVDESTNRLYTMNGGVYGVGVTNLSANTETSWTFGGPPYGVGVATLPGGRYVFGASGGPSDSTIRQFDRATGTPVADYPIQKFIAAGLKATNATNDRAALRITPNGKVLFTFNADVGNKSEEFIGIIGLGSINVGGPVSTTPVARFSATAGTGRKVTFDASLSTPGGTGRTITKYAWNFGDGATGAGVTVSHTYKVNGTYKVTLTITTSAGKTATVTHGVSVGASTSPTPTPTPAATGFGGYVFNDTNANGGWNSDEAVIAGARVYIDANGNGTLDKGERGALTNATGRYQITGIAPGTYKVALVPPAGFEQTRPTQGGEYTVTVAAGVTTPGITFGAHRLIDTPTLSAAAPALAPADPSAGAASPDLLASGDTPLGSARLDVWNDFWND